MRFLIAPDGFKGGMSSSEFCSAAKYSLEKRGYETYCLPLTDGGDGFVSTFTDILGGDTLVCRVTDPNFFIKNARYGVKGDTAIIGAAECCGLAKTMIKNPLYATSYGLGEAVDLAKKLNKKKIVIGLGGSATNDGGAGVVCALGGRFFDKNGEEFTPVGNTLKDIERIDLTDFDEKIAGMEFTVLADVKNPLLGKDGCSYRYAMQKGAKEEELAELEENMKHFAEKTAFLNVSPDFPGAGAAGGLGYCFKAFFKAEIVSGAEYALDESGFDEKLSRCDAVITGEGKFDDTSFEGKICSAVIDRAKRAGKKVYVMCGLNATDRRDVIEINDRQASLADNIRHSAENLQKVLEKTEFDL